MRSAEDGRPDALADLLETEVIPAYARERVAALVRKMRVRNTGRPSKRNESGFTPTQIKKADAFEKYWRLQPRVGHDEAIRLTTTKDVPENVPKNVLERVIARGDHSANVVLRARGVI